VSTVAVDSSIAVPALLSSHPDHRLCREAAAGAAIPVHGLYETYSVLTRLPGPLRASETVARDSLRQWFPPESVLSLPDGEEADVLSDLAGAGVSGGAVYDGLIAWVARRHGTRLRSRDGRAARTYVRVGVDYELV
jgi:predicted nucleic acid-binding protein